MINFMNSLISLCLKKKKNKVRLLLLLLLLLCTIYLMHKKLVSKAGFFERVYPKHTLRQRSLLWV